MESSKNLIDELIKSLITDSKSWMFGKHRAVNNEWGIEIWIANGWTFYEICEPTKIRFNLFDRLRLREAVKECRALCILQLKAENNTGS